MLLCEHAPWFFYDVIGRLCSGYPLARLLPSSACLCFAKSVVKIIYRFRPVFLLRFLVGEHDGLGGFVLLVVPPVGLEQDCVDLLETDGFGAVSHGFDHGADTEVFDGSEGAFRASDDELEGFICEGAVRQANAV